MNIEALNAVFGEAINRGSDGIEKAAEAAGLYVQDKLRENSFTQKILPPQTVTTAELRRNVDDEGFSYIDDLEPDSIATTINMRGEPDKVYMSAPRYEIKFFTISSQEFVKSELELRTYRMPLTKVIEQNTVKDLQEIVDLQFMRHVKAGLMYATTARMNELVRRGVVNNSVADTTALNPGADVTLNNFRHPEALASYLLTRHVDDIAGGGLLNADYSAVAIDANWTGTAHANYNPANGQYSNILLTTEETFSRTVLRDLMKVAPSRELKGRVFLLHEFDWVDTIGWLESEAGLRITEEIVVEGYKYATVGGYTFVTTVRDNPDILQPGQIFAFPAPEFLGRHMVLENTKFYIDKRGQFFHMHAWQTVGIGLGNMKGLALILLASAQVDLPGLWMDDAGAAMASVDGGPAFGASFTLVNDASAPIG